LPSDRKNEENEKNYKKMQNTKNSSKRRGKSISIIENAGKKAYRILCHIVANSNLATAWENRRGS